MAPDMCIVVVLVLVMDSVLVIVIMRVIVIVRAIVIVVVPVNGIGFVLHVGDTVEVVVGGAWCC